MEYYGMTRSIASPGELVAIRPLGPAIEAKQKTSLVKTNDMEIVQIVMPEGANLPNYEAHGEIILHCLEGRISLTALGETYDVRAGQLLYLRVQEPFSLQGIENASLLVTILRRPQDFNVELIGA